MRTLNNYLAICLYTLSLIIASVTLASAQSTYSVSVNYTGNEQNNSCATSGLCGGNDFSSTAFTNQINYPWSDTRTFQDPIPGGAGCIVTNVEVTMVVAACNKDIYGASGNYAHQWYSFELNGELIDAFNPDELPCTCLVGESCQTLTFSKAFPHGISNYEFGGLNTFDLNLASTSNQHVCIVSVDLEFTVENSAPPVLTLGDDCTINCDDFGTGNTITGHADHVTTNYGVEWPGEALGAPDAYFANLWDENDAFTLALEETVPAGGEITILWKSRDYTSSYTGPSKMFVEVSSDGTNFNPAGMFETSEKISFVQAVFNASQTVSHVKIRNGTGAPDFDVESISFSFNTFSLSSFATSVTQNNGVVNPNNALGAPDDIAANLWDETDWFTLSFDQTVSSGNTIVIRWKSKDYTSSWAGPSNMTVEVSSDGSTFHPAGVFQTSEKINFVDAIFTTTQDVSHVKIKSSVTNPDFDVDAISSQLCESATASCPPNSGSKRFVEDLDILKDCNSYERVLWENVGGTVRHYRAVDMKFVEYNDGTALLKGRVQLLGSEGNPKGWDIVFNLSGNTNTGVPKLNGNCSGSNTADWQYYTGGSGTFTGWGKYTGALIQVAHDAGSGFNFQVGTGANLKNPNHFGASDWLTYTPISNPTSGSPNFTGAGSISADYNFNLSAPDECDVLLTFEDEITGDCPIIIERTWTADDGCNQVSDIQTITINDDTPPEITCPADVTVECGTNQVIVHENVNHTYGNDEGLKDCNLDEDTYLSPVFDLAGFTGIDWDVSVSSDGNLDGISTGSDWVNVEVSVNGGAWTLISNQNPGLCGTSEFDITKTLSGESNCSCDWGDDTPASGCPGDPDFKINGNAADESTVQFRITFHVSNSAGSNVCYEEITLNYIELSGNTSSAVPPPNTDDVSASDDCGSVTIEFVADVSDNQSCPETITRIYSATDYCGNVATCHQIITVFDEPVVDAGADQNVCDGEEIIVNGTVTGCPSTTMWSTSGDGSFIDPSALQTTYNPGSDDITNGSVTLTLTAVTSPNCQASDHLVITFDGGPMVMVECSAGSPSNSFTLLNQSCDGNNDRIFYAGNNFVSAFGGGSKWAAFPGGTFTENNDGAANLIVSAYNLNNNSLTLDFDVTFLGKTSVPPPGSPKTNSGCGTLDPSDWRYYTSFSGTATGGGDIAGALLNLSNTGPAFQAGPGASLMSDPDDEGASGWITYTITSQPNSGGTLPADVQMDFNFVIDPLPVECTICENESVTLTASANSGTPPYIYSWSTGATTASITVSPASTTTYSVTVTDANGCSDVDSIQVMVTPGPDVTVIVDADATCGDSNGILTANPSGGTPPYTYMWSNGASSQTISGLSPGTYLVTVTDANGCDDTAQGTINNIPPPTVTVNNAEICIGDTAMLTAVGSSGTPPYTFMWSTGETTTSIEVSPNTTTTYKVTLTDANGCIDTAHATVTVNPNPAVSVDDEEICAGDDATLTANASGGTPGYSYEWSTGATTASITVSPASTTTYSVTVTDSKGCTASTSATVTVNPNPSVTVDDEEICAGDDATLTANASGGTPGYTYEWSTGATTASITVSPASTTTYSVTVTDTKGCTASTSAIVTVNPNPAVSVDDEEICAGDDATLTANASGGTPGYSYEWSTGATTASITVSPASTTTYSVTVTDSKGCVASTSATVTINPNPIVDAGDDVAICAGNSATLTANGSGGTPLYSYAWSNGATSQNITVNPATTTTYIVTLTDSKGCTDVDTVVVTVNPNPQVAVNDATICAGDTATLSAFVLGGLGPITYAWSNGSTTPSIKVSPATTTQYSVTVTDPQGCTDDATSTVTVNPNPSVDVVVDSQESCAGNDGSLTANPSGGTSPYSYSWSNGATTQTISGLTTGTYIVTVTDSNGCVAQDTGIIEKQCFDLALRKTVLSSGPYSQGSAVTFQIEVINQGTLDATNVEVTDYIPAGLNLNDAAWNKVGNLATRTIAGPIVANGGSATVTISFTIDANFQGTSLVNYAEISDAENALNLPDFDSTPDQDNTNDAGGQPNSAADDAVDGDGTGVPGDGVAATDEDDHDPALINLEQFFDLALRKTTISAGPYTQGSMVTYQIEVINQGTLDATNVEITDYIPTGLNLTDGSWAQAGNLATRTIAGPIAANGGTATVTISFQIDANFQGTTIVNYAEISDADNALNLPDIDSTPDQDNTNDAGGQANSPADDAVNGDGTGIPGDGVAATDEDDHDPALITLEQVFDLALRKTILSSGPYSQGSTVTFQIEVINQGTLDATDVEITDYIPAGLNLSDGSWAQAASLATKTIAGPIAANGGTATTTISFTIDANFQGTTLVNYAEISDAENALNLPDVDSTPDQDNTNDAGGQPNSAADDFVNGDGTGTPGDGVAATDEDDHDPALINVEQFFDLALRKTTISAGPYTQGSTVTYQIEVINQGTLDATNVEITDYIPTGLNLTDGSWAQAGNLATRTIAGPIAANGGSATVTISFQIDANFQGTSIVNYAEISDADNALNLPDIDSTPDQDNTNDAGGQANSPADDAVNGDGTGTPGDGVAATDEDDHDPALITLEQVFDLALRKTIISSGPFSQGSTVTFQIEVINQGTLDATNVEITDYIPAGLNLSDGSWAQAASLATKTIAGPIAANGGTATTTISFTIDANFQGTTLVNYAEISDAENALNLPDVDSTPDQDNTNDAGGQPNSAADDFVNGDGTGTPGDGVAATDEDDHDPALINVEQFFDLALRKTTISAGPYTQGSTVTYQIEVINQGTLDATNVEITDYIPTGLNLTDGTWAQAGNLATKTIAGPIAANGGTATVTISFQIDANFQGTSIVNYAEISDADNALNLPDIDSTPDQDNTNDAGGQANSPADDAVNGDGTGTPGDGVAATDEDDHDPALITLEQVFDLALRKTIISSGPYSQGSTVTFQIEVINQGTLDATDVEITDYIPAGLNLTDGSWAQAGNLATKTIAGPIAANGGTATTTISFTIDANFQGTTLVNYAEISDAENALNLPDVDSTPDQDNTNDAGGQPTSAADDFVNGDGTGTPGDGVAATDEDDHDPALINVEQLFDLALRKTTISAGPYTQGSTVTYQIEVINQGTLDATNVEITDYIPTGLNLTDGTWAQAGNLATKTIAGPIAANGGTATVTISFQIDANFQGTTIVNYAEISDADNALNLPDIDSTPDQDNTNDAGGQANSPADDAVNGDGTGIPGDGVAATDEDDHDPALIALEQVFDLALRKTILSSGPYSQGSIVTFQVEVINQGTLDATDVEITDYIPAGLNLTDGSWAQAGNLATKTIAGPIAANGGTATTTISFTIDANFQGTTLVNYAEISDAENALNLPDVDSTPDQDNTNDAGGQPNSPADDFVDGNGTGTPGDGVAATDEDDHDPALINVEQVFDLALRKTTISSGPYTQGSTVTYQIEVINQGTLDATNVEITDYIPTGLNLTDGTWAQAGNLATKTIAGPIAANGGTATVTISFQIDANFQGTTIVNYAEISDADNALNLPDIDSTPDQDNTNDAGGQANSPADDAVNGDGTGIPGDGVAATDEDDHDPALITLEQVFDLALRKTILSSGPYSQGSIVTFQVEVINQGTLDATDVEITDYIPAGLNLTDGSWAQAGNLATKTIAGPIAANGGTATTTISFTIDANFQGTTLVNYAEISDAENALNLPDVDSTPDQDNTNDAGGQPTSAADDFVNGDGTGTPGDGVAATDEDDHDPALINVEQVFDLALRKTTISSGPYTQGSTVTYQIEVINQGTLDATNVEITDYIPTGLNLTDGTWAQAGNLATKTIAGPIAANGGTATVTISFQIDANFQGTTIVNYAEISDADNALNLPDIDSTPDQDNTNDAGGQANSPADDAVNGDGTGTPGDGVAATDEDDHDPALITLEQVFDLALRKTIISSGPYSQGSTVTFQIEVINQGTLDATNVEITDYIPAGLNLTDGSWAQAGSLATKTIAGPIAANGGTATTTISFTIDANFQGTTLVNYAEISDAENALNLPDVDSTPDQDNTNDAGGQPTSAADDFVNGDGTGTPGDGVAATDEDDHDPALINVEQFFDLALRKTTISAGPYTQGSTVTYQIEVINQGTLDATNVEITDYIPTGLNLTDGTWAQAGNLATKTIAGPIAANGGTATVTISFQIDANFQGTSIVNYAEISDADNALNLPDIDSTPDQDNTNDAGGQANSPADDAVNGDGTGTPGDGVAATDEDDHDPALITLEQVFDLALRKTIISSGPYSQGSTVTFQIEVINQGTLDATNVEITDYIPAGLNLSDGSWAQAASLATKTIAGPIAANGGTATTTISFTIDANFQGTTLVNYAEISDAENALNLPDVDSTPDQDNTNDAGGQPNSAADDFVNGDGTGTPGDGVAATDEDDHDPALINVEQVFDLALRKSTISSGPYFQGSTVTFQIEVINQGTLDATNVEITDYIPAGLTLTDGSWAQAGNLATKTIAGPIAANGGTAITTISFTIDANFQGTTLVNYAEISDAENALNLPDVDSTPDQDNTNDAGGQPNSPADDAINGDGTGTPGDGVAATDEDDHDPALISVELPFDLALRKTLLSPGPFTQGSSVTFQIEIINQGGLDGTNVEITDYIPAGLTLTDGAWAQAGNLATRTIAGPIAANGGSATVTITFQIDANFQGSSIVNYAEISDFDNAFNLPDDDSTPDQDNTNDAGGQPNSPADDFINGDGTGTPGDGVAATDEDDHDPALITLDQKFDLALRKFLVNGLSFTQGNTVTFQIEVINQGTIDATNVEITDYIPTGLTLTDATWSQIGNLATKTIAGPIAANGGSAIVTISFLVNTDAPCCGSIVNYAEISNAENALNLPDADSTPDQDNTNDAGGQPQSPADNFVNGDGTGTPGDGVAATDEDDHDSELINTFDNQPPVLTCAPDDDLGCNPATLPGPAQLTGIDNCQGIVPAIPTTVQDDTIGCIGTLKYKYTVMDTCGNIATCIQTITYVVDNEGPLFDTPGDDDLGCNPSVLPGPAQLNANDNCLGIVPVSTTTQQDDTVGCVGTLKYRYSATDTCGNLTTGIQTITYVVDNEGPVFDCPLGGDLGCNPDLGDPMALTALDNCLGVVPVVTSILQNDTLNCLGILKFKYTASDTCGNMTMCTQTFTYTVDTLPPTIVDCPDGGDLGCNPASLPLPDLNAFLVEDNCAGSGTLLLKRVDTLVNDTTDCLGALTYRYTAEDFCGNISTCYQAYTYAVDHEAPQFDCPPGDDLGCNPASLPDPEQFTALDNCLGVVNVSSSTVQDDTVGCVGTLTYKYSASDTCDNVSTCFQTYTYVVDNEGPVFDCPPGGNLGCNPASLPGPNQPTAFDNCLGSVPVASSIFLDDTTGCVGILIYKYSAMDTCGNATTCFQTYAYAVDNEAPVFECPPGDNLGCNPPVLPAPAQLSADDNCLGGLPVMVTTIQDDTTGCVGTLIYKYSAADTCDNIATCFQTFTYAVDNDAPAFDCPQGGDLGCNPATLPAPVQINATDNCLGSVPVASSIVQDDTTGCVGILIYKYSATDTCGNAYTCFQTYAYVVDNEAPVFECPAGDDLGCNPPALPGPVQLSAEDNCLGGLLVTASTVQDDTSGCIGTLIYKYSAEDTCGNVATCFQTFTYAVDNEAPVFDCPLGGDLGCNPDIDDPIQLTAIDACIGIVQVTGEVLLSDTNGCDGILIYKFTASDTCGNMTMCTQTFTYTVDTLAPTVIVCPTGTDLGCNPSSLPQPNLIGFAVSDNCAGSGVEPTKSVDTLVNDTTDCLGVLTYRYSATDFCGNTVTCLQIYTYTVDNDAPQFDCPAGDDLGCNPANLPGPEQITATDNCLGNIPVTATTEQDDTLGCVGTLVYKYSASDACGNVSTCFQTFTYAVDNEAPVFDCPPGGNLGCNPTSLPGPAQPSAFDNCLGSVPVISSVVQNDTNGCVGILIYKYSATDTCGNANTCFQTYAYVVDNEAPQFECPPGDNLGCNPPALPAPSQLSADDNCLGGLPVQVITTQDDTVGCVGTLTYKYSAADTCGNITTCFQTFTYAVDNDAPVFDCPPGDDLGCNPASLPTPAQLVANDNCLGTIPVEVITVQDDTVGCTGTLTYKYSASDNCGNVLTCFQTFNYDVDNDAPVFDCPPGDDLGCNPTSLPGPAQPAGFDNCLGTVPVVATTIQDDTVGCVGTLIYKYSAQDTCGNVSTCFQTFTYVVDNEGPVFDCPQGGDLGCNPDINVPVQLTAVDACIGNVPVTGVILSNDTFGCDGILIYKFTATDNCGNMTMCTQTFTYTVDTTAPNVIVCPVGTDLGCNPAVLPQPNLNGFAVSDNCAGSGVEPIKSVDTLVNDTTNCLGVLTYRYSAEDFCGNVVTCLQSFTYTVDNEGPQFDCPQGDDLGCNPATLPGPDQLNATDSCIGSVPVTAITVQDDTVFCVGTLTYKYSATDACGNTTTCFQTYTYFVDSQGPYFDCPQGDDLGCNPATLPNPAQIIASDNCMGMMSVVVFPSIIQDDTVGCVGTLIYKYTATDPCTNVTTCFQTYTYTVDDEAPVFDCPPDDDLGCNPASLPGPASPSAIDDCAGVVPVIGSTIQDDTTGCVGTLIYKYSASDACGHVSTCFQTYTYVVDNEGPVFDCPQGGDLGCNPDIDDPVQLNAVDACIGVIPVTGDVVFSDTTSCIGTLVYKFTAADTCGNVTTCTQTFTYIVDNTPPNVILCPQGGDLGCNPDTLPNAKVAMFIVTDNCAGSGVEPEKSVDTLANDTINCQAILTYRYTAVDFCGNVATCIQTFTYGVDDEAPQFDCPAGGDLGCNPAFPQPETVTVTDNCEGTTTITGVLVSADTTNCHATVVYRYTASDACGNETSCSQVFTYRADTEDPVITCLPDLTLECGDSTDPANGDPATSDNCGDVASVIFVDSVEASGQCPVIETIFRTWIATDSCGNTASCVQVITVVDDEGPVFAECPTDANIGCGDELCLDFDALDNGEFITSLSAGPITVDISAYAFGGFPASARIFSSSNPTPGCFDLGTPNKFYAGPGISSGPGGFELTNNRALDNLIIIDQGFGGPPDDHANGDSLVFEFSEPVFIGCLTLVDIENPTQNGSIQAFDSDGLLIGTAFAIPNVGDNSIEDLCINKAGVTRLVVDFDGSGAVNDICFYSLEKPVVTAFDECQQLPADVTCDEQFDVNDVGGCTILTVTRQWTASDTCGNVNVCDQTITIVTDFEAPDIVCPVDVQISCGDPVPPVDTAGVMAFDNCTDPADIIIAFVKDSVTGSCPDGQTIRRIYSATDTCGNTSLCAQVITVVPAPTAINATAFLGGALNPGGTGMESGLVLPATQPYSGVPFGYNGSETCGNVSQNVIDWVLLELREEGNPSNIIAQKCGLLLTSGEIVDVDEVSAVEFEVPAGMYHLALRHRNHLGVMTEHALDLTQVSSFDFTTAEASEIYMGANAIQVVNGKNVLIPGNVNQDALVNNTDLFVLAPVASAGLSGVYDWNDVNLDGLVNNTDLFILAPFASTGYTEALPENQ